MGIDQFFAVLIVFWEVAKIPEFMAWALEQDNANSTDAKNNVKKQEIERWHMSEKDKQASSTSSATLIHPRLSAITVCCSS
jgi:hypothetical protein